MNKPTPNTTSKRIIALILLLSQVLSSCLNVNVPSKQELTDVEKKHTHAPEDITEQTQELSEISSLSLTDEKKLVLVEENPSTVPTVSQRSVAPTPSSITIKNEPTTLAGEQPVSSPNNRINQEQARVIQPKLFTTRSNRSELDHIYKKQSSDKRIRQQESASKQAATIPHPSEFGSLKELASITFTAKGGHQLNLMMLAGQLIADVNEQPLPGFSRPTLTLPVVVEPGSPISELTKKHSKEWQQAYIEVFFPERAANGAGYVYIGRRGVLGGGNSGSKGDCGYDADRCSHPGTPGHAGYSNSSRSQFRVSIRHMDRDEVERRRDTYRFLCWLAEEKRREEQRQREREAERRREEQRRREEEQRQEERRRAEEARKKEEWRQNATEVFSNASAAWEKKKNAMVDGLAHKLSQMQDAKRRIVGLLKAIESLKKLAQLQPNANAQLLRLNRLFNELEKLNKEAKSKGLKLKEAMSKQRQQRPLRLIYVWDGTTNIEIGEEDGGIRIVGCKDGAVNLRSNRDDGNFNKCIDEINCDGCEIRGVDMYFHNRTEIVLRNGIRFNIQPKGDSFDIEFKENWVGIIDVDGIQSRIKEIIQEMEGIAKEQKLFEEECQAQQRAEEEARMREWEAKREEARKKAEAARKAQGEARRKEEEAKKKVEEEARKKAEEAARQKAEAARKAKEEARRKEEEAKRKAEEEACKKAEEEEAKKKAEEEAHQKEVEAKRIATKERRRANQKARRKEAALKKAEEKGKQAVREQLETKIKDCVDACQRNAEFTKLREGLEMLKEQLQQNPDSDSLQTLYQEQLAAFQNNALYKQSVELGIQAAALRREAEEEMDHKFFRAAERIGNSAGELAKVRQHRQEAITIKKELIKPLRKALGCPNTPGGVRRAVKGMQGFRESFYDTGKTFVVDLPMLLKKVGVEGAESLIKWEDKLGIKEGCANLGKACQALFDQTKQEWENPAAYEARMEAVRELERRQDLFRRAFDAENYHLHQDKILGYAAAEMVQFLFGGEIIKGVAKGASKGTQLVKKVQQGVKVEEGVVEAAKAAASIEKGVQEVEEGVKVVEGIANAEAAKGKLLFNKGVLEGFAKHAFAGGRHADLGLSVEAMASKGLDLIEQNMPLLKAGDNTLIGNINEIQKSFKVFVKDGKIMSVNMYSGVSNRVTQGTIINYGNVTW